MQAHNQIDSTDRLASAVSAYVHNVFLTLNLVPSISFPGHPELMGGQWASIPRYVVAHPLQKEKKQKLSGLDIPARYILR